MELSPEEKKRIYEEEKVRIEAQEKAKKESEETKQKKNSFWGTLGTIILILWLLRFLGIIKF